MIGTEILRCRRRVGRENIARDLKTTPAIVLPHTVQIAENVQRLSWHIRYCTPSFGDDPFLRDFMPIVGKHHLDTSSPAPLGILLVSCGDSCDV